MIALNLKDLAVMSVTNPAQAAQILLAQNLRRDVLWLGLALAIVLNTLLFSLSNMMIPGPEGMPLIIQSPMIYAGFVGGGVLATIISIHRVGAMLGGQGSFDDVMVLMVWMQFLRVAVQAVAFVLMLTIPILSFLLVLGASLIGLFIFLHFIDQAHGLGSLMKAAGVLVGSILAIAVVLFILLSLLGAG